MPTRLSFNFLGQQQIDRTLLRVSAAAQDASPAFDQMGDRFAEAEAQQFASEGAYGSTGWAPLSDAYAAWKAAHYGSKPILQREGDLVGSLTSRPFDVDVVEAHTAAFGTSVPYAMYHQWGTPQMPARPVIDLPESERQAWVRIMQRWLITGVLLGGGV